MLKLLNPSRISTTFALVSFFSIATIIAADQITVWMTWLNFPEFYAQIIDDLRVQTVITTSVLSIPLFLLFTMAIYRIEGLRRKLEVIVNRDDLTGILSREAFLKDIERRMNELDEDEPVHDAFLIADADFFKRINDTHGHVAGDRALITITNALKRGIRNTDRLGRLGGEEFGIHLRNVTEQRAKEIADRLRENVKQSSRELNITNLELSVSIGAVTYSRKSKVVDLMLAADKLLYRAKDNGRDRVELEGMENPAFA